ncbi:MAG TPA: hypothetical protein V6D00_03610 [Pantanalinema sp.]
MSFKRYSTYKASGVKWLDVVPSHWEMKRLRYVAALNPPRSEVSDLPGSMPVSFLPMELIGDDGTLRLLNEKKLDDIGTGYSYFREGDITIAKITPCYENGKGALMQGLVNGIGFGTTELIVVRPNPELASGAFLHYLFNSSEFRKLGEGQMYGAGGQKRIPDTFVRDFKAALPPLVEQGAIVDFLDRETAKIDVLVAEQQRLVELLEEKRQAVISHAVTKGLNSEAAMNDSGIKWLGEVPAHWKVVCVRRIIERFEQGWSPDCLGFSAEEGSWGVLKSGCVNWGVFNENENKALPESLEPIPALEVRAGDVLMSRASGSPELIGSVAYVYSTRPALMLSDKIFRLHPSPSINPEYLVAVFNSTCVRAQIVSSISGAEGLANNLSQASIKSFYLVLPPRDEQAAIIAFIKQEVALLDRLSEETKRAIATLQERRCALISAAVTGQIDVRTPVEALAV